MDTRGIGFVGTHTTAGEEMGHFLQDILGLAPTPVEGTGAAFYAFPNGDVFGVAAREEGDPARRTIGFVVNNLDAAVKELHAAEIETDAVAENARWRYVHFTAPDGMLYELAEERNPEPPGP